MPRKKLRKIYDWRKERSGRRAGKKGKLKPASRWAFRARQNKRETKHTIIDEAISELNLHRRGGQWRGQVKIADDFDVLPDDFMNHFQ